MQKNSEGSGRGRQACESKMAAKSSNEDKPSQSHKPPALQARAAHGGLHKLSNSLKLPVVFASGYATTRAFLFFWHPQFV